MLLPGRKGQDGDLGAAPAAPECSLPFGSAGGQPGLEAYYRRSEPSCYQALGFLLLGRLASLSGNLHKMTDQVSTGRAKVLRILARQALNCRTGQPLL